MEIMQILNIFLFWVFFGLLAAHFAKKRGRSQTLWFMVGFLFGPFGAVAAFLVSPVRRQQMVISREKPSFKPFKSDAWIKMWYYLDISHKQQGPVEFPDLIKIWKNKELSEKNFIWGEGMNEWKQLAEMPELVKEMEQH